MTNESLSYTDYENLFYRPSFAAECLGLTPRTLKTIEEDAGLDIRRIARGTVMARAYTPADVFRIAAVRREKGYTKALSRPVTISTFIQKGGTAKTTCSGNLAIYLALQGLRVLLIDNDPQGDATSMFGYDPDLTGPELVELGVPADRAVDGHFGNLIGVSKIFPPKTLDEVIKKPFGEFGPHLIPAEESLDDMELALNAASRSDFRYAMHISNARAGKIPSCDLSAYDVIIFDNPPSGSLMTLNTMVASDMIICPIRMDKFAFRALTRLAAKLEAFREDFSRAPEMAAIPTMFVKGRPRMLNNLARLSELFPGKVTDEKLYHSEDYMKALEEGIPLLAWSGAGENSAGAMRAAFAEVFSRLKAITA